jgi:hypothetical protein
MRQFNPLSQDIIKKMDKNHHTCIYGFVHKCDTPANGMTNDNRQAKMVVEGQQRRHLQQQETINQCTACTAMD